MPLRGIPKYSGGVGLHSHQRLLVPSLELVVLQIQTAARIQAAVPQGAGSYEAEKLTLPSPGETGRRAGATVERAHMAPGRKAIMVTERQSRAAVMPGLPSEPQQQNSAEELSILSSSPSQAAHWQSLLLRRGMQGKCSLLMRQQ